MVNFYMRFFLAAITSLAAGCANLSGRPVPLASGDYPFVHKYAEHPDMPSIELTAQIRGHHIRLINYSQSAVFPIGVIDEGDLLWHASSEQWIIGETAADASASEVGGCSDGPTVVDLERRIYWTC
ncbi:MAG TPA: hypothetical protein VGD45_09725 [Steroidobacter sp.]|uniref:hypothetical protein n=1 Tax=Steroidobacter sp. TaxID=1978227 RepID=UPI002EDA7E4F